ncbi:osteoclast stimulatory transmembrane protein [Pelodytes ibericus]
MQGYKPVTRSQAKSGSMVGERMKKDFVIFTKSEVQGGNMTIYCRRRHELSVNHWSKASTAGRQLLKNYKPNNSPPSFKNATVTKFSKNVTMRWDNFLSFWNVLKPRIHNFFLEICCAYYNPAPANWKQLVILIIECSLLALLNGIFLYIWLSSYLHYDSQPILILSVIVSIFTFCVFFLVHPVRCILTIMIPSICTKQGRNLFWSSSFMVIMFQILPNILTNIRSVFQTMKCVSQHSSENILNSTQVFQAIVRDVIKVVTNVKDEMANVGFTKITRGMKIDASIETSLISRQILKAAENIKEDFLNVELQLKNGVLMTNRILAGVFILYLLFNATWYLKCYLTDLEFDNAYITKRLEMLALEKNAPDLLLRSSEKLIKSTGLKFSREELCVCLIHVLILFLFVMLTALVVLGDHMAFQFAMVVGNWVYDLPPMHVTLQLNYLIFLPLEGDWRNRDFSFLLPLAGPLQIQPVRYWALARFGLDSEAYYGIIGGLNTHRGLLPSTGGWGRSAFSATPPTEPQKKV